MYSKVGIRGRHVQLPEGYYQVKCGEVVKGDKYLIACDFALNGKVSWEEVDKLDLEESKVSDFDLLIRKNPPLTNPWKES